MTDLALETQFLCSRTNATLWTNALGIIVAITIARLFRLFLRLYQIRFRKQGTLHKTPDAILWHQFLDWRHEQQHGAIVLGSQESDIRMVKRREAFGMALKMLLLTVSYVGILACGSLTARLATDSKALSTHPDCGLYENPTNVSDQAGLKPESFNAESESAQFAESCFHAEDGADGCGFFLQQSIPYSISDAPCPFQDVTMCLDEGSHIIHFSPRPVCRLPALQV